MLGFLITHKNRRIETVYLYYIISEVLSYNFSLKFPLSQEIIQLINLKLLFQSNEMKWNLTSNNGIILYHSSNNHNRIMK